MHRRWDKSKPPRGPFTLNKDSDQAAGLVGWWPMGGASGGNYIPDLCGQYHMASVAAPLTLGDVGQPCASFNGTTSLMSVGTCPISAYGFSVSAWAAPLADGVTRSIFSMGRVIASAPYFLMYTSATTNTTAIQYQNVAGQGATVVGSVASAKAWVHIGATVDATSAGAVWTNGANKATGAGTAPLGTAFNITSIGVLRRNTDALFGTGLIGECGLYNIVRSDAQMVELANPGQRFALWYPLRSRKWFASGSISTSVLAGDGAATGALVGAALAKGVLSVDGTSAAALVGVSNGRGVLNAGGSSSGALVGKAMRSGIFNADGTSAGALVGRAFGSGRMQADGAASGAFISTSPASQRIKFINVVSMRSRSIGVRMRP